MYGKINNNVYDPLTNFYYKASNYISPHLYNLFNKQLLPNHITYSKGVMFLISILSYLNNYSICGVVLYVLYTFLECLDGEYSRVTNQITDEGDLLHYRVSLGCNLVVLTLLFLKLHFCFFIVLLYYLYFTFLHISCEEYYITHFGTEKFKSKYLCGIKDYIPFKTSNGLLKYMSKISMSSFGIYHTIITFFLYILS